MSKAIITPTAILSYPALFEPRSAPDGKGDPKYQATLVFPAGTDITALKKAAMDVLTEAHGAKADALVKQGKLKLPFRDDGDEKGYPKGAVFINCRSKQKPGLVSRYNDPKTGKARIIDDPAEVYAGMLVRASIAPFYYDNSGNKGVSFALNNIQKMGEGERLDGRLKADDEFSGEEQPEASPLD